MAETKMDWAIPTHLQREIVFQTAGILPPNGLLFGFHTVRKAGEEAVKLGCRNAFVVTDETVVGLGFADIVQQALEKEKIRVTIFGHVEPEPHMETADALYEIVKQNDFDLVVGLGGGSVMDMAKLISLIATNRQTPFEMMSKKNVTQPGLKKILIPTTAGTGSEVSRNFLASAGKEKYFVASAYAFPEIAIIDPGLTFTLPPRITASTGIDALSHAVESLMHKWANPFYDSFGLAGIELIFKYLRRAFLNGQDAEARYYMSMGATMAMISMSGTGALYAHSIGYVLALFKPLPHGISCGLPLPYTMAFNVPVIEEKMARIARAMGEHTDALSPHAAAQRAAQMVFDLLADVKMPLSLKELELRREDLPEMAEICLKKYPREMNPRPMSPADCRALFEAMWAGKMSFF